MDRGCLADLFIAAVDTAPDVDCMHYFEAGQLVRSTYAQTATLIADLVQSFDQLNIKAGHRVACFFDDVYLGAQFYLSAAHTGIVGVPLDQRSSVDALRDLVTRAEAVAILTTQDQVARCSGLGVPVLVSSRHAVAGAENLRSSTQPSFEAAMTLLRSRKAAHDSYYVIQPTSGTTGLPKLMLRTQVPFTRNARLTGFLHLVPAGAPCRRLVVNPPTHGAGLHGIWVSIASKHTIAMTTRSNTEASLVEARLLDPHIIGCVPRILRSFRNQQLAAGEAADARLLGPSARIYYFGGARLDQELGDLLESQGVSVFEIYGTSETGILVMSELGERKDGWAGKKFDDVELKLGDDGELLARTQCMMAGYLGDEEQTAASYDEDGFYRTGDFAEIDARGMVKIVGRKKDVFNTPTGNNISPARIEELVEVVPGIKQVLLIGDSKPFIVALLSVDWTHPELAGSRDAATQRLVQQLAAVNANLQPEEWVRRIIILDEPMGPEVYQLVGHGKVRRNRKNATQAYGELIAGQYAAPPSSGFAVPT